MSKRIIHFSPKPNGWPNCDPRDIIQWKVQNQKRNTVENFIEAIYQAMLQNGPYTHNIISSYLRMVDELYGRDEANSIITRMGLDTLGWSPER